MDTEDPLAGAWRELPLLASRLGDLLLAAPDLSVLARASEWTVRHVAVHVAVGARYLAELAQLEEGQPAGPKGFGELSELMEGRAADIVEDHPVKLGTLVEDAVEDFIEAWADRRSDAAVDLAGAPATLDVLAAVLMGELDLHGYDMAFAIGQPWPIEPAHAGFILAGYAPILWTVVNPDAARGHTAGYAVDFGGGPALTIRFTDGALNLEAPGAAPVDATILADPVTFLMVAEGRLSRYEAIALGVLRAQGPRPELALGYWDLFIHP